MYGGPRAAHLLTHYRHCHRGTMEPHERLEGDNKEPNRKFNTQCGAQSSDSDTTAADAAYQ